MYVHTYVPNLVKILGKLFFDTKHKLNNLVHTLHRQND